MLRWFLLGLVVSGPLALSAAAPAAAAIYCTAPGVPVGCVARPVAGAPGAGAPGVGVLPGPGPGQAGTGTRRTNRGAPGNRPGRG